jgi:hypothetical protein
MHRHAVRFITRSFTVARPVVRMGAAAGGGVGGAGAGPGAPVFAGFAGAVSGGGGGPMSSIATCGPTAAAGRFRVSAATSAFAALDLEAVTVLDDT